MPIVGLLASFFVDGDWQHGQAFQLAQAKVVELPLLALEMLAITNDLIVHDYGHLTQAGSQYVINNGLATLIESSVK